MLVLGLHGGFHLAEEPDPHGFQSHDAAAVIVEGGEVLAAIEEERLNRLKHANCFPVQAIRYCLANAGAELSDLDLIALTGTESSADEFAKLRYLENAGWTVPPGGRDYANWLFRTILNAEVGHKLRFRHHHIAHAWSTFVPSGFERSLILVIDGDGDRCSGMVLRGRGNTLEPVKTYPIRDSLGHLYQNTIRLIGYGRFDEYKVMGLAPYGDPDKFRPVFEKCYQLLPDGEYRLADWGTWFARFDAAGLIARARRKGEPFTEDHQNVAAALQRTVERIVMHVLRHYRKATGESRLCLAGGVAHNCSMNGMILRSGLFDDVYVQPAAHDAGCALGAAWSVAAEEDSTYRRSSLRHLYLGSSVGSSEAIASHLAEWDAFVEVRKSSCVTRDAAELLAAGGVVGWAQGHSEFGPRALGNRSILADPRPAENREIINRMVKKREAYRPFAPSVLEEYAAEYFKITPQQKNFPFMIFVLEVKEHARRLLGAITHVDGTARVQTVSRNTNPLYWELIEEFRRLTGIPILLNTSFNNHAEPIVDSVQDAVACFLTTQIPYLVIGDYIVTKRSDEVICSSLGSLVPELPSWRRLTRSNFRLPSGRHALRHCIESTRSHFFGTQEQTISPETYALLSAADGVSTFDELKERMAGEVDGVSQRLPSEIQELWANRVISLRPRAASSNPDWPQERANLPPRYAGASH